MYRIGHLVEESEKNRSPEVREHCHTISLAQQEEVNKQN